MHIRARCVCVHVLHVSYRRRGGPPSTDRRQGEQCVSCSALLQALDVRECVCVYGANVLSLVQSSRPLRERVVSAASGARGGRVAGGGGVGGGGGGGGEGGGGSGDAAGAVQAGRSAKELLMTLPCPSAQTVSKYNSQYHKLFQCVPKDEILMKGNSRTASALMSFCM